MNDNREPGSPVSSVRLRARIASTAANLEHGPAGRIRAAQILRDIEALHPGEVERQAARIQARRLGLPPLPLDLSLLDWPET
jgi:hypothetical protein